MQHWLVLGLATIGTGLVGGVVSGLLGVGGGIVIVPMLEAVLGRLGVAPAMTMPIAVATSLATIVPTSLSSALAHHRHGAVDLDLARRWAPPMMLGAAAGAIFASRAASALLTGVFGVVAAMVA